ncbi:hypothetical protein ACJRO7_009549 [Eucalyptus globulus]|uniref:Uncharacterized protein n=1 Tax=Eucalyptus globulus TaxID=34317 RepID=A0ABD3L924_EUCGL
MCKSLSSTTGARRRKAQIATLHVSELTESPPMSGPARGSPLEWALRWRTWAQLEIEARFDDMRAGPLPGEAGPGRDEMAAEPTDPLCGPNVGLRMSRR